MKLEYTIGVTADPENGAVTLDLNKFSITASPNLLRKIADMLDQGKTPIVQSVNSSHVQIVNFKLDRDPHQDLFYEENGQRHICLVQRDIH